MLKTIDEINIKEALESLKEKITSKGFNFYIDDNDITKMLLSGPRAISGESVEKALLGASEKVHQLMYPETFWDKIKKRIFGENLLSLKIYKFGIRTGGSITYFLSLKREGTSIFLSAYIKQTTILGY
jgi:hypothetical protein